jgi:hypothetical protein
VKGCAGGLRKTKVWIYVFFWRAGKTIKSLRNQQGKVQADVPKGKRECGMDKERPSEQLGPQVECMMAEQHRSPVVTYQTNGKKR